MSLFTKPVSNLCVLPTDLLKMTEAKRDFSSSCLRCASAAAASFSSWSFLICSRRCAVVCLNLWAKVLLRLLRRSCCRLLSFDRCEESC